MCKRNSTLPVNADPNQTEPQEFQEERENRKPKMANPKSRGPSKRRQSSQAATHAKIQKKSIPLIICEANDDDDDEEEIDSGPDGYLNVDDDQIFKKRYQIIKKLGTGGFASVYKANDKKTGKKVALKIARCGEFSNHFSKQEVKFMKTTKGSSNIVTLIDNFSVKGRHGTHDVMVLEMMGPDLYSILMGSNQGKLTVDRIKKFCRDILKGLNQLHDQCEIVHLDLKPENIMITIGDSEAGRSSFDIDLSDPSCLASLKIGDLGQAAWSNEDITRGVQNCIYRAPEAMLRAKIGAPADMWSFGAIAYELATGSLLYQCRHEDCEERSKDTRGMVSSIRAKLYPDEIQKASRMNKEEAVMFSDFLLEILKEKPEYRLTAKEALEHEFIED